MMVCIAEDSHSENAMQLKQIIALSLKFSKKNRYFPRIPDNSVVGGKPNNSEHSCRNIMASTVEGTDSGTDCWLGPGWSFG